MNKITFPITRGMTNAAVADLQAALQTLLDRSLILANDPGQRRELSVALARERPNQTFGSATRKLLEVFQGERRIDGGGEVDERTATALNATLRDLGLLDVVAAATVERRRVVSGRVSGSDQQPFRGRVRAFHVPERGTIRLGDDDTDADGNYTIHYQAVADAINLRVSAIDDSGRVTQDSPIVRNAGLIEVIDLVVPLVQPPAVTQQVEGRIVFDHGAPAEGLKLRLYRKGFGGAEGESLLKETTVREQGVYSLPYKSDAQAANLEVRAVDANGKEVSLSTIIKNATATEVLNLVAPATMQPMAAEFNRLSTDLQPQIRGDLTRLRIARETADQQDLTLLHEATGWDARLIATAAMATRLSAADETGLPQDALYGILRVGLPSDKLELARVSPDAFDQALNKARTSGIVNLTEAQVAQAKRSFAAFSTNTRLAMKAPGSQATYGELLGQLRLSTNDQQTFANVYLNHRDDGKSLWEEATAAGLGNVVPRLQKQGKLAFLTTNNPTMMAKLQTDLGDAGPEQMVRMGLYKKEAWLDRIDVIPPAYAHLVNPKDAYASDLARKIRISYSTEVAFNMIETGELKIEGGNQNVSTVLRNASAKGFKLGETPIDAFLRKNPDVFQGIEARDRKTTTEMLKTLQRVYQITPGNDAMKALLNEGLVSAQDVLAYPLDEFLERFGPLFSSLEEANLVYRKAQQVSNITYSLFSLAKELDNSPPVHALSDTAQARSEAKTKLIKHFPTMESLFGSLDFCECEHCRSVLGPAAYMVDILQFLDREPLVWQNFLKDWKNKHGNAPYPFRSMAAFNEHPDPNSERTPYEVLIQRRPDLPHILLTCENTNTALPQIDLVNEILEYYVANNSLKADAARDTGDATTAELLAEPQYVINEAYTALQNAHYPLALPFDLWVETARQFTSYFEVPLWRLLEIFRKSDALFAPAENYDHSMIFFESLGLSPAEIAIYTDPNPLAKWFELYGFATESAALTVAVDDTGQRIDLNSAKALARRLGVTYKELVDLVNTGFINPTLQALVTLRKLEVDTSDVFFYQNHRQLLNQNEQTLSQEDLQNLAEVKAFEKRLDDLTEKFKDSGQGFNARTWLQSALAAKSFDTILVLADSNSGCNFDATTLQFANGDKADALTFLKFNLFVRLWRRLGWTIEEIDRALQAFLPKNAPFDKNNLSKSPLKSALIYMAHLNSLATRAQLGKYGRLKLLTLWSSLPTTGANPLYSQLFLQRNILKSDPIFDHPLGLYLNDQNVPLKDHLLALQAALGLTSDDIDRILKDAGDSLPAAKLTLANVSLLYRYALLAKVVKLPVRDLVTLKQLSGRDPFKSLEVDPLTALDKDHPFSQTLDFLRMVDEVSGSGFKIEDLEYLLRNSFDENGKYRAKPNEALGLLRTLAAGIHSIRLEHAVPDDPGTLSEEVLRQKLGLILAADVVERFLAMMNGSAEFTASAAGILADDQLHRSSFVGEPSISQMTYNAVSQRQSIGIRGVLFDAQATAIKDQFNANLSAGQQTTLTKVLDAVKTESSKQAKDFFSKYLEKQPLSSSATVGFLSSADFDQLIEPLATIKDDLSEEDKKNAVKANQTKMRNKRSLLATTFLPYLQTNLIRQFVVQTLVSATAADPALIESLLVDKLLLTDPTDNSQALLSAFTTSDASGVSANFFASSDGKNLLASVVLSDLDSTLKNGAGVALKPAGTNSATFSGYLEVPAAGTYRFFAVLGKKDAKAELRFDDLQAPVFSGTAAQDKDEIGKGPTEFVELKPRVPYHFTLTTTNLNSGDVQLLVQGETLNKDSLSRLTLYADASVDRIGRAQTLIAKSLQLIQTLELSQRELHHILSNAANFDNVSLSALPAGDQVESSDKAANLFKQFLRLAAYSRLKRELAGGADDLIDVFEAGALDKAYEAIARIGRREKDVVQATAEALFTPPAFPSEINLIRLWDALQLVELFGVPVAFLTAWATITKPPVTPADHQKRAATAKDLKDAIKTNFEPETWLRVAQPIFDRLRQLQRNALAAHVMHQHHFDRLEELFDYFLIDPGVEPVVQTSRIRSAIAAVQIFINRCLLNLEPGVASAAINSNQWQWMKRYPVWAGNRKLWLFPENVLEPEFRDDKTHLYTELEGALLQSDVTNDLVEDAFFKYLKKMDELARLDIVAMYCEEQPQDPASNQLHVIGRTYLEPHKYFYRRYAHEMWTPWEPMSVEIEGNHIVPVIWRDRLNLFWVTFIDNPDPSAGAGGDDDGSLIRATQVEGVVKRTAKKALPVAKASGGTSGKKITDLTVNQIASGVRNAMTSKLVKVQLHWSEYFQGAWSVRESGGYSASLTKSVPLDFDNSKVFIHASKEFEEGEERAVKIHLGGDVNQAFRVVSRNSRPTKAVREPAPRMPYIAPEVQANRYAGQGAFKVTFAQKIEAEDGKPAKTTTITPDILSQGGGFTLLPCANNITLGSDEIASLVTPLFYQDDRSNTFYVEPTLKEQTIEEWQEWVTRTPVPELEWDHPEWWGNLQVEPLIPKPRLPAPVNPGDPLWRQEIDPRARFDLVGREDWLANPATVMQFDGELIGPRGHAGLASRPEIEVAGAVDDSVSTVSINAGSAIAPGNTVVTTNHTALAVSGLATENGGLNVVGSRGLNSALLTSMKTQKMI